MIDLNGCSYLFLVLYCIVLNCIHDDIMYVCMYVYTANRKQHIQLN